MLPLLQIASTNYFGQTSLPLSLTPPPPVSDDDLLEIRPKRLAGRLVYRNDPDGIWLYRVNCLAFMDLLIQHYPQGLFDMIFADPPYFLSNGGISCHAGKMVKVDKGSWDKSQGPELNHEFNTAWLSRCQQLLKPKGTLWVSGTHHVIHSVGFAMQQLGLHLLNDITWHKPNPPPHLACRYFTHATETLIWARKTEKSKHYFNYPLMKKYNGGKQMKSVWQFTAPGRVEKIHGKHPTQKPIALLERVVLASTRKGGLVFDPFTGSSTTGIAALMHGRRFVGCDAERKYINLSVKRLEDVLNAR